LALLCSAQALDLQFSFSAHPNDQTDPDSSQVTVGPFPPVLRFFDESLGPDPLFLGLSEPPHPRPQPPYGSAFLTPSVTLFTLFPSLEDEILGQGAASLPQEKIQPAARSSESQLYSFRSMIPERSYGSLCRAILTPFSEYGYTPQ